MSIVRTDEMIKDKTNASVVIKNETVGGYVDGVIVPLLYHMSPFCSRLAIKDDILLLALFQTNLSMPMLHKYFI